MKARSSSSAAFTVLAVSREIQNRTGLTIRRVCRELRPLRSATIAIDGSTQTFPPVIPPDRRAILDAFNHGPVAHQRNEPTRVNGPPAPHSRPIDDQ